MSKDWKRLRITCSCDGLGAFALTILPAGSTKINLGIPVILYSIAIFLYNNFNNISTDKKVSRRCLWLRRKQPLGTPPYSTLIWTNPYIGISFPNPYLSNFLVNPTIPYTLIQPWYFLNTPLHRHFLTKSIYKASKPYHTLKNPLYKTHDPSPVVA